MYQAEYKNFILDAGYYNDGFIKIIVVKNCDWKNPIEEISCIDSKLILPIIVIGKDHLIKGFYTPNEGVGREL